MGGNRGKAMSFIMSAEAAITIPTMASYNYMAALPEIILLSAACFILILDLFIPQKNRVLTYLLAQATLVGLAVYTVMNITPVAEPIKDAFGGAFVRDNMGDILKIFMYVTCVLVFVYSRDYLKDRKMFKGEYFVLGLFGVLGMMVMVSSASLLTLYIGLEIMSLTLYAMVAFKRDSGKASEAAMKYFVLGAIASGMLLYGISILYGVTGHIGIAEISQYIGAQKDLNGTQGIGLTMVFALVFILIGLAFKLGAVPFHMWMPDVYDGAPTCVTLYIGTITKIAAFAMVIRVLVDGLSGLMLEWQQILVVLAILSLAVGNIVAIAQTNIKRMLAYSTISHIGFLLLGILAGNNAGYASSMFYILTYALMSAAAFGLIIVMTREGHECDQIKDLSGLNERSPWFAFLILIVMFSLAGVPPTVGFFAKLQVLNSVIDVNLTWLAVVAVGFSIIGAYYYIRIVKVMYFDKPDAQAPAIKASFDTKVIVSANSLLVLGLGLFPGALIALCNVAFKV